MYIIRNFLLIILLINLTACVKTTLVRSAPNYKQYLSEAKLAMLLPPKVVIKQVDAFNKKTPLYSYEDKAEDSICTLLIQQMCYKGYYVQNLTRSNIGNRQLSAEVLAVKDDFDEALNKLYASRVWKEESAFSINYDIPSAVRLGKILGIDLLIAVNFYSETKTTAAIISEVAIEVLKQAFFGSTVSTSPVESTILRLAIIDANNGKILWTHSVGSNEDFISTTIDRFGDNNKMDNYKLIKLLHLAFTSLPSK